MITSLIRLSAVLLIRRNGESLIRDSLGSGRAHRIRVALRFHSFLRSAERTSCAVDRCDQFACLGDQSMNEIKDSENMTLSALNVSPEIVVFVRALLDIGVTPVLLFR